MRRLRDRVLRLLGLKRGEMALSAVVIRADGTREELGVISRTGTDDWKVRSG